MLLLVSGDVDLCLSAARIFISSNTNAKTDLYGLPGLVSHENTPCFFIWAGQAAVHSYMICPHINASKLISGPFFSYRLANPTEFTFPSTLQFDTIC